MYISEAEYQRVCDQNRRITGTLYNKLVAPEILHNIISYSGGYVDRLLVEYEPSPYRIISANNYLFLVNGKNLIFFRAPAGMLVACKPELDDTEEAIMSQCFHMTPKRYGALMPMSAFWYSKEATEILVNAAHHAVEELCEK